MKINKLIIILFLVFPLFFSRCEKEKPDPCSILVDGVFVYPNYPEDGWKSDNIWEEQRKYFAIPDDVLSCISTEGLIQSILNHPNYKVLLFVHNTWQEGFDRVYKECNGLPELAQRNDAPSLLISRYQEMNPLNLINYSDTFESAEFRFEFWYLEIIMAQPFIYTRLSGDEKSFFFGMILDAYEKKLEIDPIYGVSWGELNLGILARIMDHDKYHLFIDEYESCSLLEYFIQTLFLAYNNDCIPHEIIYFHSKEYLKTLKKYKNEN